MPYIDYFLTTEQPLTQDRLKKATQPLLTPDLDFGARQWNKKQLAALTLVLCNIVEHGHRDGGVFLYSRKREQVPDKFNPNRVGYRSLIWVIDALTQAKLITGAIASPRVKGKKAPRKLSEFHVTPQVITFAKSLGITKDNITEAKKGHVRLRALDTNQPLVFEHDEYTTHTEMLMAKYCALLNQHNILLSTEDYEDKGLTDYGLRGEPIHLYRNYRNYSDDKNLKKDMEKLWIETNNPNFSFGGRSGGFWQGAKKGDRPFILIDGNKTKKADLPCAHLNLCYKNETGRWYQEETFRELKEAGRQDHQDNGYLFYPSRFKANLCRTAQEATER